MPLLVYSRLQNVSVLVAIGQLAKKRYSRIAPV